VADQRLGFQDLKCWQLARRLVIEAHEVAAQLPSIERHDLASQMRRSSKSVMANIAEGYGRYHYLDKLRFFYIARGSLDETINHIITCFDLQYISESRFSELHDLAQEAHRTLNGYIGYVRKQQQGVKEFGRTVVLEERVIYVAVDEELVDEELVDEERVDE
jgi:four helix bundle protein